MNVKELRAAIAGLPDDTLVHAIYDGGYGLVDDPEVFIEPWQDEETSVVIDLHSAWQDEETSVVIDLHSAWRNKAVS